MSQQINLFNQAFQKQRLIFSLLTMLQALAAVILGSLLFYGYAVHQGRELDKQFAEDTKRFNAEKARMVLLEAEFSPQQSNKALQDDLLQLEKKLAEQTGLIETLKSGAVGNTTGYSEYMRAFSRQVVQGLWLTGFQVSGGAAQVSLSGAVLTPELLPAYIQRLGQESVMQGKTFATLQMQQPKAGGGATTAAPLRYVEFTLHSIPDSEAKNSEAKK